MKVITVENIKYQLDTEQKTTVVIDCNNEPFEFGNIKCIPDYTLINNECK